MNIEKTLRHLDKTGDLGKIVMSSIELAAYSAALCEKLRFLSMSPKYDLLISEMKKVGLSVPDISIELKDLLEKLEEFEKTTEIKVF